jgi:RNA-binding protein
MQNQLTKDNILALRKKVHALSPVVIIGNDGLTANVIKEINIALNTHELIKIRINAANREVKMQIATDICDQTSAIEIKMIGHILAIYRKSNKPKKKKSKEQ